jgi:hypothetical protein
MTCIPAACVIRDETDPALLQSSSVNRWCCHTASVRTTLVAQVIKALEQLGINQQIPVFMQSTYYTPECDAQGLTGNCILSKVREWIQRPLQVALQVRDADVLELLKLSMKFSNAVKPELQQ